jgi:hypothetical protein
MAFPAEVFTRLTDSLLQLMANLEAPDANDKSGSTNRKKKNISTERGFKGTLLHSSSAQNQSENGGEDAESNREKSVVDVSPVSDEQEKDRELPIVKSAKKKHVVFSNSSDDNDLQFDMVLRVATEANVITESDSSYNGEKKDSKAQTPISKSCEAVVPESPSDRDEGHSLLSLINCGRMLCTSCLPPSISQQMSQFYGML